MEVKEQSYAKDLKEYSISCENKEEEIREIITRFQK
jgi:hypothetical protein